MLLSIKHGENLLHVCGWSPPCHHFRPYHPCAINPSPSLQSNVDWPSSPLNHLCPNLSLQCWVLCSSCSQVMLGRKICQGLLLDKVGAPQTRCDIYTTRIAFTNAIAGKLSIPTYTSHILADDQVNKEEMSCFLAWHVGQIPWINHCDDNML